MMTVFELIADFLHMFSISYLLMNLIRRKSCGGVSGKTQLLFAIVYTTRYIDLWTNYISAYNSGFKILYIISHYVIVFLIFGVLRKSYKQTEDIFVTEFLLVPSFLLALWFNYGMTPTEIMWSFSTFLEAVTILPQFYMIYRQKEVEKSLLYYIIPLGFYRLFYIFHWICRYYIEDYFEILSNTAGGVYVCLYMGALILLILTKVKIVNDYDSILERKIFAITEKLYDNERAKDSKKVGDGHLLAGNV